jgi:undecaprenyl-diphosphatase
VSDATLTDAFILASAWWVKSLVFVGAALWHDLRRRAVVPVTALTVAVAFGLGSLASTTLKVLVDRERPDAGALIDLPESASFPSGHATTAFAAAVALSLLVPRWRWWALPLAAVVAYSRVYLGVHYWSDIVAGAVIGAAVAWWVVAVVRRRRSGPAAPPRTRPRSRRPPSPRRTAARSGGRQPTAP